MRLIVVTSLFIVGPLPYLILPGLMLGLAGRFHWSDTRLGVLATIELGGMAVISLTGLYWQNRWNWRWLAVCGALLIVAGDLASTKATGFSGMAGARLLAGLGGGVLVALYFAFLAHTKHPERNASVATFAQISAQVLIYFQSARILDAWGLDGLYELLAGTALLLLPFIGWVPNGPPISSDPVNAGSRRRRSFTEQMPGLACLLANGLFFTAEVGIFSFFGEFGQQAAALTDSQTLNAIGLSTAAGLLGPAASYFLGQRLGYLRPLLFSAVAQIVTLLLLGRGGYGYWGYLTLAALLQALWQFTLPNLYGLMVVVDESLMVAVPGAQAIGIALGPTIIGYAVEHAGLAGATWIAAALTLASLGIALPLCNRIKASPVAA